MSIQYRSFLRAALLLLVAGPLAAQSPLLEIATDNDFEVFQVDDSGGLVAKGTASPSDPPGSGAGTRLMWWPAMAALRAGRIDGAQWDPDNIGLGSVALGENTISSGDYSLAFGLGSRADDELSLAGGRNAIASGQASVALGYDAEANGTGTVAMGINTLAEGDGAIALGFNSEATAPWSHASGFTSTASGAGATAAGIQVVAAGQGSVALGSNITAGEIGSFAFGDDNESFQPDVDENSFVVRAFGGVALNTGVNIGCDLPAGEGAWVCTSSRLAKEGFTSVDGETLLARLAGIEIQQWRYRGSDILHLGPTAEDFNSAFGLGGEPTGIATVDADGVALLAVQALERRTAALQQENGELRRRLERLEARLQEVGP